MTHSFENTVQVEQVRVPGLEELLETWSGTDSRFLLESGIEVGGTGRWNFWGGSPIDEWTDHGRQRQRSPASSKTLRPMKAFDEWFQGWKSDRDPLILAGEEVPFTGGAVGWLSYEALDEFYQLGTDQRFAGDSPGWLAHFPLVHFSLYDELFVQHRESGQVWFLHRQRPGWEQRMDQWISSRKLNSQDDQVAAQIRSAFTEEEYLAAVRTIQKGIGEGDYYEVNLARGYLVKGCPSPAELHRRWRQVQPVPYGALIQTPGFGVVSASPEQFLQRRGSQIKTRPIKGTVPRTGNVAKDEAAAQELRESEKERAELAMIIDLERNDLGRICEPGSVKVTHVTEIESYSSVLHAVATIDGVLAQDFYPGEILEATFPGGSITGAPKRASMCAIRELEPWPRCVYTGSIGWLDCNGDLEFNIAIRTAAVYGDEALIPFGGAITWDSDCKAESREIGYKAKALLGALGLETHPDRAGTDLQE